MSLTLLRGYLCAECDRRVIDRPGSPHPAGWISGLCPACDEADAENAIRQLDRILAGPLPPIGHDPDADVRTLVAEVYDDLLPIPSYTPEDIDDLMDLSPHLELL